MEATGKLWDLEVDAFLATAVQLDEVELRSEFCKIGALIAYYGTRHARAQVVLMRKQVEAESATRGIKEAVARAYESVRNRFIAQEGKATEARIDAGVVIEPSVVDAKRAAEGKALEVADCTGDVLEAKAAVDALKAKRDALISVGASQRAEMQGDPALRSIGIPD